MIYCLLMSLNSFETLLIILVDTIKFIYPPINLTLLST